MIVILCHAPQSARVAGPRPRSLSPGKADSLLPADRAAPDVRQLIDGGFQAFNAGRLSEACHIFADKMLRARRTTRRSG